ncbi:MAG: hypothetical protein JSS49_10045 [Planctomycetes bacterium]|nr:hypothetical protein [Planctomycetota bacterium]
MTTPSPQSNQLRSQLEPCIRSLPANLLYDIAGSLFTGIWKNLEAEGRSVPTLMADLTGLAAGEELDALVTRVLVNDFKNWCLTHAWRVAGLKSVMNLIRCSDAETLQEMHRSRQSAIFVFSHFGPKYAVAPAFQHLGVPIAMFQGILPPALNKSDVEQFAAQLPGMEYYWINDRSTNRAMHLKRAVERLQRGDMVATAIDAGHGEVLMDTVFFGHQIQVARGAAVLARLTKAPLIPLTLTWGEGWTIDVRIHEPITLPQSTPLNGPEIDVALTHAAVRFFDNYLRNAPEQLRLDRIARLITKPRAN